MDVVLQAAVLGVGQLQSVLHVLQLTLVATLHLNEKTLEDRVTSIERRSLTCNLPPPCSAAADSAPLWLCSAGSAGPTLSTETIALSPRLSACCSPPAGGKRLRQLCNARP